MLRQWDFEIHQLQQQTILHEGGFFFYVTLKKIGYIKEMPETVSHAPNICSSFF